MFFTLKLVETQMLHKLKQVMYIHLQVHTFATGLCICMEFMFPV